jgi:hypothetical protein
VNLKAHSIDNQVTIGENSRLEDLLDILSVICNVYVQMLKMNLLKHSSDTSALFFSSSPQLLGSILHTQALFLQLRRDHSTLLR